MRANDAVDTAELNEETDLMRPWKLLAVVAAMSLGACSSPRAENAQPTSVAAPTRAVDATVKSSFGDAVAGFPECSLPGLYVDLETGQPAHPYFSDYALSPCETTKELQFYCLKENFHGLRVSRLAIPRTTFPVFGLYLDADITLARKTLKKALGSEYRTSQRSDSGIVPELVVDPKDRSKSVLICTKEF